MKLSAYIKQLQAIEKQYGNLNVVYACDEEGNSYDTVGYSPTVGNFDSKAFSDEAFTDKESAEDEGLPINAICIN